MYRGLERLLEGRLLQIHISPHTFTSIARREPQVQPAFAARHIVAGPSIRRRPLGAVLGSVYPPCAIAHVGGGVGCAVVGIELLGGTAVIGDHAGGWGLGDGGGV